MTNDDPEKAAKQAIIEGVVKAAQNNPDVQVAGKSLAKSARTVTTTIENALLPLAALNFGIEKARVYFREKFPHEMVSMAQHIPPENIVEPKASIAAPVLQGLAFAHEEEGLREMYLHLLAGAMDGRVPDSVHPAYAEIIKQLTSEEAQLLAELIPRSEITCVEVIFKWDEKDGYRMLHRNLVNLCDSETKEPIENPRMSSIIENWSRMGLIEVIYGTYVTHPGAYKWVDERPEVKAFRRTYENEKGQIDWQRGVIIRTNFGELFGRAVGISEPGDSESS